MKYLVIDNALGSKILKKFNSKDECQSWLMEGLFACEGAERDHYVYMLGQLKNGKTKLNYWENF